MDGLKRLIYYFKLQIDIWALLCLLRYSKQKNAKYTKYYICCSKETSLLNLRKAIANIWFHFNIIFRNFDNISLCFLGGAWELLINQKRNKIRSTLEKKTLFDNKLVWLRYQTMWKILQKKICCLKCQIHSYVNKYFERLILKHFVFNRKMVNKFVFSFFKRNLWTIFFFLKNWFNFKQRFWFN